jgi:hypothetical protein
MTSSVKWCSSLGVGTLPRHKTPVVSRSTWHDSIKIPLIFPISLVVPLLSYSHRFSRGYSESNNCLSSTSDVKLSSEQIAFRANCWRRRGCSCRCIAADWDHHLVPPTMALARRGTECHIDSQRSTSQCPAYPILSQLILPRDTDNSIGRPYSTYRDTISWIFRRRSKHFRDIRSTRRKWCPGHSQVLCTCKTLARLSSSLI